MEKIPTVKEFYLKTLFPKTYTESLDELELWFNTSRHSNQDVAMMIQFAKLHVEAALKARDELYQTYYAEEINWTEDNIKFIKNSYPLENIK
jgi:hypothetical protein